MLGKSGFKKGKPKERKFVWLGTIVLHIEFFCIISKWRERNKV
jgi:hypothetical protein